MKTLKSSDYILLALILTAFAANSLLNRLALKVSDAADTIAIDPASFTLVRLVSGALVLVVLLMMSGNRLSKPTALHLRGAVFLFVYAITFSFAYIALDAAMGALILFGVVQICIICIAIVGGKHLVVLEWLGCTMAVIGLLVLTLPHIASVAKADGGAGMSQIAIGLMVVAGIAWGLFTVNGASSTNSLFDTANCFVWSVPLMAVAMLLSLLFQPVIFSGYGLTLAVLSGALASGLGYALWYQLLPKLSPSQAASSQLLVPIIAAIGGFMFLQETLSLNFIIATILTLGGVLIVIKAKS